jgi:O-antigen/teichoic acid export membrane protein
MRLKAGDVKTPRAGETIDDEGSGPRPENHDAARMGRQHVRGSMLLLAGRILSLVFTTATQVVLVRVLSKGDFGVFAYAFTIVASSRILLSLGQGQLLSRFMSKYDEERDFPRMFGSMLLAVGTIFVTSTILLLSYAFFAGPLLGGALDGPRAVQVLLILMFCAPMQALDQVFVSIFAVFSKPTAIFFRKYIVTPLLQLVVVLGIAVVDRSVVLLAMGYVVTSFIGIAIYAVMLVRVLRERNLLYRFRLRRIILPWKEVFAFSIPTMTTQLEFVITNMGTVVLLAAYGGAVDVAQYRAVFPAARLNQVVYQTFVTMFLPMAARLFSRGDHRGMRDSYWHSSMFLAVATFPVFIMTTVFAPATTVTLFGHRYASSGWVLAALAFGYYFSVTLGFNAYVLQVYGRLRYLVISNIGALVLNMGLAFLLIPWFGALGAAIAGGGTMVAQNIVNQIVLSRTLHAEGNGESFVRPYLVIASVAVALAVFELLVHPGIVIALVVTGVASLFVLRMNRHAMQLGSTFPELLKLPLLGRLLR